jgi:hypothetical protein
VCKPLEQSSTEVTLGVTRNMRTSPGLASAVVGRPAALKRLWRIRKERTQTLRLSSQCAPFVLRCALLSAVWSRYLRPKSLMLLWTLPLTRRMSAVRSRQHPPLVCLLILDFDSLTALCRSQLPPHLPARGERNATPFGRTSSRQAPSARAASRRAGQPTRHSCAEDHANAAPPLRPALRPS